MEFESGQTGVIVPVPAVGPLVDDWRRRFDSTVPFGVPPHVTVVFPFVPFAQLTDTDLFDLRTLFAGSLPPTVSFTRVESFPGVLWLAPEPAEPFRVLTRAMTARWPDALPYGGEFGDDIVPHLTVTDRASADEMATVRAHLEPRLPLTVALTAAVLIRFDGEQWVVVRELAGH